MVSQLPWWAPPQVPSDKLLAKMGSTVQHLVVPAFPSVLFVFAVAFRVVALMALAPLMFFCLLEFSGYMVILTTGASLSKERAGAHRTGFRRQQRQIVGMFAESSSPIKAGVREATAVKDTDAGSATADALAPPSAQAEYGGARLRNAVRGPAM